MEEMYVITVPMFYSPFLLGLLGFMVVFVVVVINRDVTVIARA